MTLPVDLQIVVADLESKIANKQYNYHAHDIFRAIRDCIIGGTPIGAELQQQYVQIIANEQRQDRYGK